MILDCMTLQWLISITTLVFVVFLQFQTSIFASQLPRTPWA